MSCSFSARCDLMASSRGPSTSFIASMPLMMRFIMTCCNCTRSPMTRGRSVDSSVRTDMEYRVSSLRRRTIRDDAQHLGGGGLLLQRLDKVLPRLGELASTRYGQPSCGDKTPINYGPAPRP